MKKTTLLNQPLSSAIAGIGHTDLLAIVDSGYPLPIGCTSIDLALKRGVPRFLETLDVVLEELVVERVIIAEEIVEQNETLYHELLNRFSEEIFVKVPHSEFKEVAKGSKAVIRTGENIAFSNIILQAGFLF
jgi:D-ribose pyranase